MSAALLVADFLCRSRHHRRRRISLQLREVFGDRHIRHDEFPAIAVLSESKNQVPRGSVWSRELQSYLLGDGPSADLIPRDDFRRTERYVFAREKRDEPFWRVVLFAQRGRKAFQQPNRQLAGPIRQDEAFREGIYVAACRGPQYCFQCRSGRGRAGIRPFASGPPISANLA